MCRRVREQPLADGAPVIVLGTPGGSTIFTSVFQVLLNLVDAGLAPQDAVDALHALGIPHTVLVGFVAKREVAQRGRCVSLDTA